MRKFDELEKARRISDRRILAYQIPDLSVLNRSVIVSQGLVRCDLHNCVVFANGDIRESPQNTGNTIRNSFVFCDGSIRAGNVSDNILIAAGSIKIAEKEQDTVVVIEGAREVSKVLKLYEIRQAGVEVEETKAGVVIRKVVAGSPFAGAGFREGDGAIAINGQKITATEELRKSLRRATATGERTAFQVRREDQVIEITVKFEE